ncbi:WecB/TagA/CpsF family glycosyltransferase [Candidatus Roizmanbacteria bacterium]|nr:WecB/TagA/CpsF family glycosyltransferase [Candidatus Roizmanbacteria bacterium]
MQKNIKLPIIEFMGFCMHAATMQETIETIMERIEQSFFTQHVVVNVAKLVNMKTDSSLRESVTSCDIINIDGMGVVLGARLCGNYVPERVAGIDLFLALVKEAAQRKLPVFFLGAREVVVAEMVRRLLDLHPGLVLAGYHHGYFWDNEEDVINKIRASQAVMLFVAITSPKKENFINRWKDQLGVQFVMGVGGSFDVVAGKTKRAPLFLQKAGLEWLYRVWQEPRRMWKRYLITNSKYLAMLLRELLAAHSRWRRF